MKLSGYFAVTCLAMASAAFAQHAEAHDTIAALLGRMERAVLGADTEGYLDCVDNGTSPEWNREQDNWAADLMQYVPEAFELELTAAPEPWDAAGTLHDSVVLDEVCRAPLRISWLLPDRPRRSVEFPAMFVRRIGEWRYAGEAWARCASADGQNAVLFLDEDLRPIAEKIVGMMPAIREHVDAGFETRLEHPQVVKLYDDMAHLQQSIYLSYQEPLGGWNEPGESIKILTSSRARPGELRTVLAHEYGHVATFTYGPAAGKNLPWWVAEGAAELAAERFSGERARRAVGELVCGWAARGELADWDAMADFRTTPADLHPYVYLQGHHFMGYLSERFGRSERNQWIRRLAEGTGLDGASRAVFDLSFDELDRQWRASLQPEPTPPDES